MTPLVAAKLAHYRQTFDGEVTVMEDYGCSIIVLVTPPDDEPRAQENGGDWGRMTKPFLMLLDEAHRHGKFICEYTAARAWPAHGSA